MTLNNKTLIAELKCYTNTSKDEIFNFLQNNMDRQIEILFVVPEFNHWSNWKTLELENNQYNAEKITIIVKKYKILSIFIFSKED